MKSKPFSLVILIGIFIFTTGFIGNCCDNEIEVSISVDESLDGTNDNINQNTNESTNLAPVVQGINISQLHANYGDTPHRYQLTAIVRDPEGDVLSYEWIINCGYLIQEDLINTYTNRKEWRYDTPGECAEATITVKVYDTSGNMTPYSLTPF